MKLWLKRRTVALKHVEGSRRIIERQRFLVVRRKALGAANTDQSESLLGTFEQTQTIFEQDLAELDRRKPPPDH